MLLADSVIHLFIVPVVLLFVAGLGATIVLRVLRGILQALFGRPPQLDRPREYLGSRTRNCPNPHCRQPNPSYALYCARCGRPLT